MNAFFLCIQSVLSKGMMALSVLAPRRPYDICGNPAKRCWWTSSTQNAVFLNHIFNSIEKTYGLDRSKMLFTGRSGGYVTSLQDTPRRSHCDFGRPFGNILTAMASQVFPSGSRDISSQNSKPPEPDQSPNVNPSPDIPNHDIPYTGDNDNGYQGQSQHYSSPPKENFRSYRRNWNQQRYTWRPRRFFFRPWFRGGWFR